MADKDAAPTLLTGKQVNAHTGAKEFLNAGDDLIGLLNRTIGKGRMNEPEKMRTTGVLMIFDIDLAAATVSGLSISSRLLGLARSVRPVR